MNRRDYFSICTLLFGLIGAAGTVIAAGSLPPGTMHVQKAVVVDSTGFGQAMPAYTLMIPAGWKTQGSIVWQRNTPGCGPRAPHVNWSATSPDGLSHFQLLPEEDWSGNNMQGGSPQCPNVTITEMRDYAIQYAQRVRPGAQIIDYRERADLVQEVQKYIPPQQPMYGVETSNWVGAAEVFVEYSVQGREVRELIGSIAVFGFMRMADGMGGAMDSLTINTLPGYTYRAPKAEFQAERAEMIRRTLKTHPAWSAQMAQHNAVMSGIAAKGAADRSRIIAKTGEEIRQMQQDSWENYTQSMDRNSREFQEYIRGTETYDSSGGGTVQLDNMYEHAWEMNDGSYILTDDGSFNPEKDLGLSGNKLERSQ